MSNHDWVYDCETFPNVFTVTFEDVNTPIRVQFEISNYRNDTPELLRFLNYIQVNFGRLVGFNNVGFDYPVLHQLMRAGRGDAPTLYAKAMAIIESQNKQDRWSHLVKPSDRLIPQIDLFLINHFDSAARATSLKALEFNIRSDTIEDLPFPVGTVLTPEQVVVLKRYNAHDVAETKKFYHHCKQMIAFREELSEKYHRDFINHNDTKIGKDYFVMELEKTGVRCYDYSPSKGRTPRQTPRPVIHLRDVILPWIQFEHPEFNRVLGWFKEQSITETKGALKESYIVLEKDKKTGEMVSVIKTRGVTALVGGLEFDFGTGGIHASVNEEVVEGDSDHVLVDLDVTSMYPSIAIKHGFYPEHMGPKFVDIYQRLFEQRKKYDKKSAESAMLKLALNGVYGDSNNPYSVFFDPVYTMRTTINGQMFLCMLAEQLIKIPGLRLIQANTDGITMRMKREHRGMLDQICDWWQQVTKLNLEEAIYTRMCIRDCNAYLAVKEDGSTKRKGPYEWVIGWHQDASALVVPKVAEKVLVEGAPIRQTVENWPDLYDFMLRVKVPRSGYLQHGGEKHEDLWLPPSTNLVQNTTRYIVTRGGESAPLTKWLQPLGGFNKKGEPRDQWRSFSIEAGWNVTVCNNVADAFNGIDVDVDYYVTQVERLVMGLK